jgi:polar amino acid transport system substrate-binding protein
MIFAFSFMGNFSVNAAEPLSVSTGAKAPLATPQQDGYQNLITIELFRRLGQKVVMPILPSERVLLNLNQGIDDATLTRIEGLQKAYPNIRIVPEKILDSEFVAITNNPKIEVNGWTELKNYRIAYINGWKIFEQNATEAKLITKVNNTSQLFNLMAAGRTDIILLEKWEGLLTIKERGMKEARILFPPLATKAKFM